MKRSVVMIRQRDPGLVTVRRGGSLLDADRLLLLVWAENKWESKNLWSLRLKPNE